MYICHLVKGMKFQPISDCLHYQLNISHPMPIIRMLGICLEMYGRYGVTAMNVLYFTSY